MSQENVKIAQAAVDALNRGDWDAVVKEAAPEFELDLSRGLGPDAGVYQGDRAREWWDRFAENWESVSIEPSEFIPVDEQVVIPLTLRARGRAGIEVISRPTWVFTFGNGALARVRMFQERAEALEAVGLQE